MKQVEFLKEEDIKGYIDFINTVFGYEGTEENIKKLMQNEIVLIIKSQDKIIASVMLEKHYEYIKDKNYYHIGYFGVLEEYRRMGYAKMLFDKIEELVKENNISYLELTSGYHRKAAHALYQSQGFKIKDTAVFIKNY